jgi:capsule biosynthesis phosphatase
MKKLVIDLDGTLTIDSPCEYKDKQPNLEVVDKLREYTRSGFYIIISTARNMNTYKNNVGKININTLPTILDWLGKHSIPFDEVYVGKPWCGNEGFYVDDKAVRPSEFVNLTHNEILNLLNSEENL